MKNTIVVCSKCKTTREHSKALAEGWLYSQRKNKPDGHLVIRCPRCTTAYARRQAVR